MTLAARALRAQAASALDMAQRSDTPRHRKTDKDISSFFWRRSCGEGVCVWFAVQKRRDAHLSLA
eukprot:2855749-Rhodomonas_salina.1